MAEGNRNQTTGTANATPITHDSKHLYPGATVKVQLTASYAATRPDCWPSRPSMTGCAVANLDYPRTVNSGQVLTLLKPEADALVSAGAANYV